MSWAVPPSDAALPRQRLRVVLAFVLFAAAILIARLWWLQIACGSLYEQLSAGMRTRHIPLRAPRGVIYDRAGRPLATTTQKYMVVVEPIELRRLSAAERAQIFARAAGILNLSVPEIEDILDRNGRAGFNTIKLKSDVGPAVITHLLEYASDLPGIDVERAPVRTYPDGAVGAHVLGYVGDLTAADLKRVQDKGYNGADQIGEQGLERTYEDQLRGVDGERVIEVNARGVPVAGADLSGRAPLPGKDLVLTLDARLQRIAQEAFPTNMRGSVVALDVRTGGILALASRPGFDPNVFVEDTPAARAQRVSYLKDGAGPMQDRAISSRYPPGSTFKLVTSTAGFTYRAIDPNYSIYCAGGMKLSRRGQWKKCWSFHGSVNYMRAMAQSCDTYFYDLMKRLSSAQLAEIARQFGLGTHTGIDLGGERAGFIPTTAWKAHRFRHGKWFFGDSCNMAIGQGFIQTTPLQMAVVTALVANGGEPIHPHLVQEIGGRSLGPPALQGAQPPHLSTDALAMVRKGMRAAVLPGGTAGVVRFHSLDVAAKTGSAQDLPNPQTHAWFVCFAPYDHPRIAICVMVEHGGHGGTTAGPVARALLKAYFHLKNEPDNYSVKTD